MLMPALADKARWEGLMAEQGLASTFTQTEGLAPALPGTATYGNVRVDLKYVCNVSLFMYHPYPAMKGCES